MVLNETERLRFIEKVTSEHEIEEGAIHVSAGRDVQMDRMTTFQALGKVVPAMTDEDVRFQYG